MIPRRAFDPRSIPGIVLWLDDAQSVGQWSAKVGASATQTATNNRPGISAYGSRPVLSFDGINDTLALPTFSIAEWHAFAVACPDSATQQTVLYLAASGTQSYTLSSSASGWQVISTSGSPATSSALYGVDSRVGGGWSGGSLKGFYKGLLGEVVVYSSALSTAQANAVTRYLSAKWGL